METGVAFCLLSPGFQFQNTGVGKRRFTVVSMQNSLCLYYHLSIIVLFITNNCKPTLAYPCIPSENVIIIMTIM